MISRIDTLYIVEAQSAEAPANMALEQFLTMRCPARCCIMYLWQNRDTVVIGRHQSARDEVDLARAEAEGVRVVRRLSGGGAVFHDMDNLNFTFAAQKKDFDIACQTQVILEAVRAFGIQAEATGRNDLLTHGRKFSGMAFYASGGQHYQHGTLLLAADADRMGRYLTPSAEKLAARAVPSVAARVTALREQNPAITVASLKAGLGQALEAVYGLPAVRLTPEQAVARLAGPDGRQAAQEELARYEAVFASREWTYDREMDFDLVYRRRFSWGEAAVCLRANGDGDTVEDAVIYSDALDQDFIAQAADAIRGAEFDACALSESILALKAEGDRFQVREDLAKLFS